MTRLAGEEYKHPSYGKIMVTRCTGGNMNLFGSSTKHNHAVQIEISEASMHQDVHDDYIYGHKNVVDFYMSEAQWANFVSSFGDGSGTPITFRTREGKRIEQPPELPSIVDVQRRVVDEEVRGLASKMEKIEKDFEGMLKQPSVKKKDLEKLRQDMNTLRSWFVSNLPYYEQATIERMDKEVSRAKTEIEAVINNALQRAGALALQQSQNLLEGK